MTSETVKLFKETFEYLNKKYVAEAYEEAYKEGFKEGKLESKKEVAKKLKELYNTEEISHITGLIIKTIESL